MIVIVGAGAAGLMAAIFASGGQRPVILIERTSDGGRKILISGGGRCNVLPSVLAPERFVTDSAPHLMRGMLRSWPLVQQRAFFERDLQHAAETGKETGKLFPVSNRARDVRDGCSIVRVAARRRGSIRDHAHRASTARERLGRRDRPRPLSTPRGSCSPPAACPCRQRAATVTGCGLRQALGHRVTRSTRR